VQDPFGDVSYPYSLEPLPQAASVYNSNTPPANGNDPIAPTDIVYQATVGANHRDNVEVIDVGNGGGTLYTGKWIIVVRGFQVLAGARQDFSLVSDFVMTKPGKAIGWMGNTENCPEGKPWLYLDDEDDSPNGTADYFRTTSSGAMPQTSTNSSGFWANTDTGINLCRESMDTIPKYYKDYAVVSLSSSCPTNSVPFSITIDNENDANANYNSGMSGSQTPGSSISPSTQNTTAGTTVLNFCFVPNNGTSMTPPWWARKHGALVDVNSNHNNCPSYNWHVEDDEDAGSGNTYTFPSAASTYATRIKALFNWTGGNTQPDMNYFWNSCAR
jgi:hypothetical protein